MNGMNTCDGLFYHSEHSETRDWNIDGFVFFLSIFYIGAYLIFLVLPNFLRTIMQHRKH